MKLRFKIFSLILAVMVAALATGSVFAWFTAQSFGLSVSGGTAGAYFAYGDGTEVQSADKNTGPYGITTPAHLFNLAWLQNTGKIDDSTYFELGADIIEMPKNYVLPPIGNSDNPFNSIFNGNGHTISNLVVSTNKKILKDEPAGSDYAFSNSVGMFGMTGEKSDIKNFILTNPIVEVASTKTIDNVAQDTFYSGSDPNAVGLAIGYVGGTASSIGVRGGTLAVREVPSEGDKYTTFNSILGAIGPNIKTDSVTGSGPSTSGDRGIIYPAHLASILSENNGISSFGTNFISKAVLSSGNLSELRFYPYMWILPDKQNIDTSNGTLGIGSLSIAFDKDAGSNRLQNDFAKNGGYISKISYTFNNLTEEVDISNLTYNPKLSESATNSEKLKNDLMKNLTYTIGNTTNTINQFTWRLRFSGGGSSSQTYNKVTYGNGESYVYNTNNEQGNEVSNTLNEKSLNIQSNTIKFNIVSSTKGSLFIVCRSNNATTVNLYKLHSEYKYQTPEIFIDNDESSGAQIVASVSLPGTSSSISNTTTLNAYKFDLSDTNFGPGSYYIKSDSGGIDFYYANIEGTSGGNVDSGEKTDDALSAIDFVYDGVSIDQDSNDDNKVNAGNFIYNNSLYKASQVRITFNIAALTYITYSRTVNGSGENYTVTFTVEYKGTEPTVKGSASNSVTPKNNADLTDPVN